MLLLFELYYCKKRRAWRLAACLKAEWSNYSAAARWWSITCDNEGWSETQTIMQVAVSPISVANSSCQFSSWLTHW
jgi:hypothetical protein